MATYQSPFRSSGLKVPVRQTFLLPLPIGLEVPGHQWLTTPLLTGLEGTWPSSLWQPHHRTGKRSSTQSTVYKIKQLLVLSEIWTGTAAAWQNLWSLGGQGSLHCHLLPPSNEWGDFCSFTYFESKLWLLYWYGKPSVKTWRNLQRVQVIRKYKLSCVIKFCATLLIKLCYTDSAY